jgi:hypothetical protein
MQTEAQKRYSEELAWANSLIYKDAEIYALFKSLTQDERYEFRHTLMDFIGGIWYAGHDTPESAWEHAMYWSNYRTSGAGESAQQRPFWDVFQEGALKIWTIPLIGMAVGGLSIGGNAGSLFTKLAKAAAPYLKKTVIDVALTTALQSAAGQGTPEEAAADAGFIYTSPTTATTAGQDKNKLYFYGALALIAFFLLSR